MVSRAKVSLGRCRVAADRTDLFGVLRDRIAAHEIPPGSKLPEEALCSEFGVSRARVREALGTLAERGLVERRPNRGAVVVKLDLRQAEHLYGVREVLEGLAVRLATEALPPESWQDLVELFDEPLARDVERSDGEAYLAKLELLRARIEAGAANPVLSGLLENIRDRTRMLVRRIVLLPGRAAVGLQEHRALLAAMRRGDAAAAEAASRANLRSSLAYLRRFEPFVL